MPAHLNFARISLAVVWIVSGLLFIGLGLVDAVTGHGGPAQAQARVMTSEGPRG